MKIIKIQSMESLKKKNSRTFFSCYEYVFVCYFFFLVVHFARTAKFKVKSTLCLSHLSNFYNKVLFIHSSLNILYLFGSTFYFLEVSPTGVG